MSNIVNEAATTSTIFENSNIELKREYILENIYVINSIMKMTPGYCGAFGTGYPFYALNVNLEGELPIIDEQIRYNEELFNEAIKNGDTWVCAKCLNRNGKNMQDLKQICKPCPNQFSGLKPRKVLNRLPDIDMWMICEDDKIEEAMVKIVKLFGKANMHTSDVDPLTTIFDVSEIAKDLSLGIMPKKMLPLGVHIIERSKMENLISNMPFALLDSMCQKVTPYLPIHPYSLRKIWQKDDEAYNFVLDYLYTLTPFNWDNDLASRLDFSRSIIANTFSEDSLLGILHHVFSPAAERRFENEILQKRYKERIGTWKK